MRHAFLAAAAAATLLVTATSARANGRFPQSNQILFSPTQSNMIVVRNTFGITISKDGGNSWYWLCEDILGLPPTSNEDPFLGLTSNDSLVAGLSLGLQVSTDVGCNWTVESGPLAGQLIKDLVVHKENAHIVDTITNTYSATLGDGGNGGYGHGLFETTNDGTSWTQFGTEIDPNADVTTIEVAPSDPNRIYVSAFIGQASMRTSWLYVSKDHGMTWAAHQTPLDTAHETAAYIGGVDPNDEDVVYLRTEGLSRLIVSQDGGQTFMSSKQLTGQMLGFALSQDGSKIYIGSVEDGLFVGDKATLTFVNTNPNIHVQCLATQGADLWACSDEPSCFVAGISHDDGKTFTAKMHLLSIQGPIQCAAGAQAAVCAGTTDAGAMPFPSLCNNVGACYDVDAAPVLPLTSTCSCSGACNAVPTYDAAGCPLVANDASLYCPLTAGDAGDAGQSGSSSSGGASGSGGSGGSSGGGGGGSGGSKSSCGCDIAGGGGAFGFLAAGMLAALAARRRRGTGGRA